jgi:uncharacterized protein (UPF0261 family)
MQGKIGKAVGTIAVIGTLNNYGSEIIRLKKSVEKKGFRSLLIDISMGGKPSVPADVSCDEIALCGGADIERVRASKNRTEITGIMTEGLLKKVTELYKMGAFDGIIAVGGATTALIACKAIQALPFGLAKIIVSSSADFSNIRSQIFGNSDLMVMHAPVDPIGDNYFVINMLERAAGAICGMTGSYLEENLEINVAEVSRSCIAMVTFGYSDNCANTVKRMLEKAGFQVVVFHAQGLGDRALDTLIDQNVRFKAIVDLAPAGASEELFGGARAAGGRRLEAASEKGIPQICTPSGLNFIAVGPLSAIKKKYRKRIIKVVDQPRTQIKMTVPELIKVARTVAHKLAKGTGIARFVFPLKGWSSLEAPDDPFYNPETDRLFIERFKKLTRKSKTIEIEEIDAHINDELLARKIFDTVMEVVRGG